MDHWSVTDASLAANTAPLRAPQQHPPLIKEYGAQWEPDADAKDYVRFVDGSKMLYSEYQRDRSSLTAQNGHPAPPPVPIPRVPAPSLPWEGNIEPAKPHPAYATPPPPTPLPPPPTWTATVASFHGFKPTARFRWFVVVRRRLHHSLCFAITSYPGRTNTTATGYSAQRAIVLHSASVEPPAPYEEEGITQAPIAVIIEALDYFISPRARLDCSRLYTVEDGGWAVKVGRVHPDSLEALEGYYQAGVE
ncbi:hypothetical protein C8A05DRAFT_46414 [Staphylotrichum tortipilum]|uniref:DUF6590 domain-containing protein n=1 Tax=Staphylotrichum tortipilum TaxID=2831512 RepID=A0AAN6RQT3_9PEZI|nr:hypothetical protein C8A05DRAFT_46414 [Staphylotrichum longicolle]